MHEEYCVASHERLRIREREIDIGLSAYLQNGMGETLMFEWYASASKFVAGDPIGVVHGTMRSVEIYAPCDGTMLLATDDTAPLSGWLATIRIEGEQTLKSLMSLEAHADYAAQLQQAAR